jgi:hypothetical protein
MDASASKKASKTPPLLSRSKRLHTLFQGPKRSGRARQRTFSMVEEMKRLEESAVVLGFPAATGQAGPEHRKRVRPPVVISPPGRLYRRSAKRQSGWSCGPDEAQS